MLQSQSRVHSLCNIGPLASLHEQVLRLWKCHLSGSMRTVKSTATTACRPTTTLIRFDVAVMFRGLSSLAFMICACCCGDGYLEGKLKGTGGLDQTTWHHVEMASSCYAISNNVLNCKMIAIIAVPCFSIMFSRAGGNNGGRLRDSRA